MHAALRQVQPRLWQFAKAKEIHRRPRGAADDQRLETLSGEAAEALADLQEIALAEIGGVLNVTESRICQIHTKAVMSLRNRFIEPAYR